MTTSKKTITFTETEEENGLYDISEEIEVPLNLKPSVLIFHYPDCSGYAAAAIILNSITDSKKNYKVVPFKPPMVLDLNIFDNTSEVYITNFLFPEQTLKEIKEKVPKLIILDYKDISKSAVLLAWEKFVPEYPPSEAVSLLNLYHNYISESITIPQNKLKEVISFNLACSSMMEDFSFWTSLMNGYFIDNKLWKLGTELYGKFLFSMEEI